MALEVSSLLLKLPMKDEMMIICQITKVGRDLLNPNFEYCNLSGFGKLAIPVKFSPKSILTINEI